MACRAIEAEPGLNTQGGWRGELWLRYTQARGRTVVHDRHSGPLRVLQPLYPEGDAICHQVLVHPPGGVVGGDELYIDAELAPGTHALVTTPGATRFYGSDGRVAHQHTRVRVAAAARLEWLPLETIAYPACEAHSRFELELQPGAEAMGWDTLVLGLPAAQRPFDRGSFQQHIQIGQQWLERACIRADDVVLRTSPLGLAGRNVLATAWWAAGEPLPPARRDALLEAARDVVQAHRSTVAAGVTAPQRGVLVARALAPGAEVAMRFLTQLRSRWRDVAWGLRGEPSRLWQT